MKRITFIGIILAIIIPAFIISCNDDDEPISTNAPVTYDETAPTVLVGYCQNSYTSTVGTEENSMMGAAIRMDSILMGKGSQIIAVRIGLSTAAMGIQGEISISKRLKSKPLYTQNFTANGTGWEYVKLNTPYTINERDTLYISYTLYGKGQLIAYQVTDTKNRNSDMVMLDSQWLHLTSASITGQVCIQALVAGNDKIVTSSDLSLGTLEYARYVEKGKDNPLSVVVTNYGSHTLNGCILTYNDGNIQKEATISDNLPNGKPVKTVFQLSNQQVGERKFTIKVRPLDTSVKETNTENNLITGVQEVYGEFFERTLLMEQFTGQGCMYCPSGEENLDKAIGQNRSRVAWVAHHVGFGDDTMTIPASSSYIRFYDSEQTYAPAVMLNRTSLSWKGIRQPVFSSFDLKDTDVEQLLNEPAHVSVNLDMSYDSQSRDLAIKVNGVFLTKNENPRLTVFLVQNGIIAQQESGGKEYEHNAVIRTCLSDTWGDIITVNEDGTYKKEYSYRIPGKIGNYPCDVNKMYIVTFVANYNPTDINDCRVQNATFKYIK